MGEKNGVPTTWFYDGETWSVKNTGSTAPTNTTPSTTTNTSLPVNAPTTKYYSTTTNNIPSYTFIENSTNTPYGHQEITKAQYIAGLQSKLTEAQNFINKYDTTNLSAIVPKDKTGWDGRNYTGPTYTQNDITNFQKLITDAGGTPSTGSATSTPSTTSTSTSTSTKGWEYYGKLNDPAQVSTYLNSQPGFNTMVEGNQIRGLKNGVSTVWTFNGTDWVSSNAPAGGTNDGWAYYAKLNNPAQVSAYLATQP